MNPTPLSEAFLELRRRDFPLGVPEYGALLKAFAEGLVSSRAELLSVCQALWAKSTAEETEVAEVLARWLPDQLNDQEMADIVRQAEEAAATRRRRSRPAEKIRQKVTRMIQALRRKPKDAMQQVAAGRGTGPHILPKMQYALGRNIDWSGSLPVTRRQMKRAWQYYRRMARTGPRTELDLDRTLTQAHRQGMLLEPVLMPRRVNHARLLVLADEGGSMVPFRTVISHLLECARTGGFARTDTLYFHDVPDEFLYRDRWLADPVPLAAACSPFKDAGILIVSDGGAARGTREPVRVERTIAALDVIRGFSSQVAWLNPLPSARWERSSAGDIARSGRIAMFPLDRAGLDRAVDVLRGRRTIA